jgi:hypothetical protein
MKHYDEFDKYFEGIEKELAAIRKRDWFIAKKYYFYQSEGSSLDPTKDKH